VSDRELPYPLPGKWDPSGPFRNPGGTNPLPRPANLPVTVWFGARVPLTWETINADGVLFRATWASPVFDLYPWLRGMSPDSANQLAAGANPIWNGPSSLFRFQLNSPATNGLGGLDLRGFRATYREFGHISQVTQVESIDAEQDITAQVTAAQDASVVLIQPKNIRYYRVFTTFEVLDNFSYGGGNAGPQIAIQGAMY